MRVSTRSLDDVGVGHLDLFAVVQFLHVGVVAPVVGDLDDLVEQGLDASLTRTREFV
jgi:hypothetical protein